MLYFNLSESPLMETQSKIWSQSKLLWSRSKLLWSHSNLNVVIIQEIKSKLDYILIFLILLIYFFG